MTLLVEHAHFDPVTGLPNRRALMNRLQMEWTRVQRHGGELSFIMADIDYFKQVNDTYVCPESNTTCAICDRLRCVSNPSVCGRASPTKSVATLMSWRRQIGS
ncbi:MAG: GGDEF domain-containing protein [Pirellulaceae bacterium]